MKVSWFAKKCTVILWKLIVHVKYWWKFIKLWLKGDNLCIWFLDQIWVSKHTSYNFTSIVLISYMYAAKESWKRQPNKLNVHCISSTTFNLFLFLFCRLEQIFQRIWQEFFGALRIVTSFFILFVVEMFKYIIKYVFQPIFIGIFITTGDYVMKPVLSVLFNGFMHPTGVFCWNCCVTTKVVCNPIVEILRKILLQFAMCCRSVRCAQIFWKTGEHGPRTIEEEEIKHV